MMTVSMTWMTPLLAGMSVAVTVASSTYTVEPVTVMSATAPLTVVALSRPTTSAASTLPGTTW